MPGVLTHVTVAIISLTVVHLLHFKWEYSYAIFVGNFLPDVIKFGISGIVQGTIAIFDIKHDALYHSLHSLSSNPYYWFTLGFFLFGTVALLYHFHYIKKKRMEEYDELFVFLLSGVLIHIVLDLLIIEPNAWI